MTEQTTATAGTPPSLSIGAIEVEGFVITEDYVFGLGRDMTERERRMFKKYAIKRDGWKCSLGDDMLPAGPDGLPIADIHHRDGTRHHVAKLMSLVCHPDNSRKGHPPVACSPTIESERENHPLTRIDLSKASEEIRISVPLYEWYERWLQRHIEDEHHVSIHDALSVATRESREENHYGSPQTFRGYLDALTSRGGRYSIEGQYVVKVSDVEGGN